MFDGRHGPAGAVITPSGPGASSAAEAEALFAEAHRRRRRRRLAGGVACLLLAGSAAAGLITASSTSALAVWNPATGAVKIIGRGLDIIDVYTPPGARYSLLAWTPAGCTQHCPVGITNTATLASLTVRSPDRYGFTYGGLFTSGAFSPDGTHLAVFLNTTNAQDPGHEPVSELAIVNTRTGALRLVRAARLGTYEDVGWARWLPGGRRLIVGAEVGSYAVDAETLSVRAFSFGPGHDINFSTTMLPVS